MGDSTPEDFEEIVPMLWEELSYYSTIVFVC